MKIKTQDLIGAALDWAVAKVEGYDEWEWDRDVSNLWLIRRSTHTEHWLKGYYKPSTDWSQGGPIIERERINLTFCAGFWRAAKDDRPTSGEHAEEDGPAPLIAAMYCFVASKLGDEVDVPEGLL